ncbi:MAG: malto-oligosyltrehalose synthase [Propionicimonas sp.]
MPQLAPSGRRLPVNTYRLQLTADFTFAEAAAQLDYLVSLGVTDLYLSPILAAAPGSTHGYDVVDHSRISAQLGGQEGFEALARRAHHLGLGVVVDLVPNHMAIPDPLWTNPALWSVLREGTASPFADWFDIPGDGSPRADSRLVLAALPDEPDVLAAAGRLRLGTLDRPGRAGEPALWIDDAAYPVTPGTESLTAVQALARQHYRLVRPAGLDTPITHRRFFDVFSLIGLRVELPDVFDATHRLLLELLHAGHIDGFRVDHPDGLADPQQYFDRLQAATGGAWVVAEKILMGGELLPQAWAVAGTTGYEASWRVNAVQLEPSAYPALVQLAADVTGTEEVGWPEVERRSKRQLADTTLAGDLTRLLNLVRRLDDTPPGPLTDEQLRHCLRELLVGLDRYRAYVRPGVEPEGDSLAALDEATDRARLELPAELHPALGWLADLAALRRSAASPVAREFAVRFQQVSGALMAKGVEDTAFYRWTPLLTTCDVGGDPGRIGLTPQEFHDWVAAQAPWPASMVLGSTHDSKRSEDIRARIGVISEFPQQWRALVLGLTHTAPSLPAAIRSTVWQTLAGTWTPDGPISTERLLGYLLKAGREQKLWTSWLEPDVAAEAAMTATVADLVLDPEVRRAFDGWLRLTADAVRTATLCTKAVQLTAWGVADTYQGTETVRLGLTDPDNRRPVDFDELRSLLDLSDAGPAVPGALALDKIRVSATILRLRRRHPTVFVGERAGYRSLASTTEFAWGFARGDDPAVVTIVTRLPGVREAAGGWRAGDSLRLPDGTWHNLLTGATLTGRLSLPHDLDGWPCAVLELQGAGVSRMPPLHG